MSYVVLARKLRPSTFSDLIGQETVANTLRNAILSDRVAHAFLFTGSRGVGKTSAARILTKAINCLIPEDGNPCNVCERCVDIQNNASPDVFEIDAASNRGIENIRELRENVKYLPAKCDYKVYIIDEAHMLTLESFNALLKTLEEPPAHVKFILATTDPHKIPQTILSRCQRYDFTRIPIQRMADYLESVTQAEGIRLSRKALEMVAKSATGGMRDALTAIDQVLSFTQGTASDEEVAQVLGMLGNQHLFGLLESILNKDATKALEHFQSIHSSGHDLQRVLTELLKSIKTITLLKSVTLPQTSTLLHDFSQEDIAQYQKLGEGTSLGELQQIFQILVELENKLRQSTHGTLCFEMALIQLTLTQPLVPIQQLLEEVQALKSGQPIVKPTIPKAPAQLSVTPAPTMVQEPAPQPYVPQTQTAPQKKTEVIETPEPQAPITPEAPQVSTASETPVTPEASSSTPNTPPASSPPQSTDWPGFVQQVQASSPRLGSILKNAILMEAPIKELQLGFKNSMFAQMLSDADHIQIRQLAEAYYQKTLTVGVIQLDESQGSQTTTLSEQKTQAHQEDMQRRATQAQQDEQVQTVLNAFPGSQILKVHVEE